MFPSALDPVSFTLNPDLTAAERGELAVEVQFYGLLRLMMPTEVPYYAQEQIGVAFLLRACAAGTIPALQSAVATARELVFEMGSTTPWLTAEFQDARYVITDRVVNDAPVWAAEDGEWFMYSDVDGKMSIGLEAQCAAGEAVDVLFNFLQSPDVLVPTQLLSNEWLSGKLLTLEPQYTSAGGTTQDPWVDVPDMRVTAVHGLDDAEPAMAAALRQFAPLIADE
jgi:hypothetical protein